MSTVDRLRAALGNVHDTRGVLAILGDHSVEQKRDEVYPELVPLIVTSVCGDAAIEPDSLRAVLRFFAGELGREPTLASQLFEDLGTNVQHSHALLFELFVVMRDRRAIPLLRGGARHAPWTDAVIALAADDLLDEALATFAASPTRELAVAYGYVGGERARDALTSGQGDTVHPIGLAFLANADDKDFFATGGTPNRTTARRIHTALSARGPKARLDALGELAAGLESTTQPAGAERLIACTLALADKRADIVERAAAILAAHAKAQRGKLRPLFFPAFLERAPKAFAAGVTETTRGYLEIVLARIPNAPPLGTAKVVTAPSTRAVAAKAKGKAMLDTMREVQGEQIDQRNAGIEAQIAADPSALAAYSVYADWLQTNGDARGTWITLHAIKGLAAREALATFLREHRDSLLGPLRPFIVEDGPIEVEWFMGFVKRARFTPHATIEVVQALLDATCGAFVQELAFVDDALAAPVIALLRDRRPPALTRLVLGTNDGPPDELAAVMPQLRRDPTARWNAALERLADQRKARVELEPDEVPALVCARGVSIEFDTATILRGLKQELQLEHPLGIVAAMPHVFTPASLDAFARALGMLWLDRGQPERLQWAFAATGPLGGTQTARFLGDTLDPQQLRSTARIAAVFAQLQQIKTSAALEEISFATFAPATDHRIREAARAALTDCFADDVDTGIASTPPSGDARSREAQRVWLESIMVDGRGLTLETFRLLVSTPTRLAAARTLMWADRGHDGAIAGMFRVDESGHAVRRDGSRYQLVGRIGIVHPAELSDSELDGVQHAFAAVDQAIPQLARPTFALSEDETRTVDLTRFVRRRVGFRPLSETLRARGWSVAVNDIVDDDGEDRWAGTRAFERTFARDDITAIATLNETRGSIATVHLLRDNQPCTFAEAHVVTISELLWDLETSHGWRADETSARPASPPAAARRAAPAIERAKSGRSKCVVCTESIAKDAMRIGIERMVETPNFRGVARVWLHPACRSDVPELEGADLSALE